MDDWIQFNVSSSRISREAVGLRIDGELDLYSSPEVRDELDGIGPEVRYVLADLTGLTFMDSTGVATLLSAARELAKREGKMMLVVGDPNVLRVVEVTGLDDYFEIRDDYESAAREFAGLTLH